MIACATFVFIYTEPAIGLTTSEVNCYIKHLKSVQKLEASYPEEPNNNELDCEQFVNERDIMRKLCYKKFIMHQAKCLNPKKRRKITSL